jgi:4-hydroxyphenylpyruvate dioxygenase
MHFNYLHFFIDDLTTWHDRFVEEWGATPLSQAIASHALASPTRVVGLGRVPFVLSAPANAGDYIDRYLDHHPPGIGDIAFRVPHLTTAVKDLMARGMTPVDMIRSTPGDGLSWCRVPGWGNLSHTLVQSPGAGVWVPGWGDISPQLPPLAAQPIDGIDHAVVNVESGQLTEAVEWYVHHFGFCPRQRFTIDTPKSGLKSQVLAHPQGDAQLPINEPATPNSQVQEFLTWNRGAGIQHVALRTPNILKTVRLLKEKGIEFLTVPASYYQALKARPGYQLADTGLNAIAGLEILMDWDPQRPQAYLLQTFTQPLLDIPTLFFEIIQRQTLTPAGVSLEAQGFGERNFQALFEAIEREQDKRGSLDASMT